MEDERLNALMPVPMHPIPIVPPGDLSLLGVTRATLVQNEKSLEEFHNEFPVLVQIVQMHCNEGTRDKLALNAGMQTAAMNNDVVHYLYELKLACIRGGDTGAAKLKDYEDALLKPMMYGTGMEALHGGGESAFAGYVAAFRNGLTCCHACDSVRTDAEFIQGFVTGLHMQFDSVKVDIMKHSNINSAIECALGYLRSGIRLCIKGWDSSPPTSKASAKRSSSVAELNHNQKNATLPVSTSVSSNFNPSASSLPSATRSASLRYSPRNSSSYRDNNSAGNGLARGGGGSASSSSAGGGYPSKQVFAVHLDDGSDDIELCLTENDMQMISSEQISAAEKRGEERAFNIFHMGAGGAKPICHEWSIRGECSKRTHKSGDVFLKCYYDHPEIGQNFRPSGTRGNK
jgi:hypothetical protein